MVAGVTTLSLTVSLFATTEPASAAFRCGGGFYDGGYGWHGGGWRGGWGGGWWGPAVVGGLLRARFSRLRTTGMLSTAAMAMVLIAGMDTPAILRGSDESFSDVILRLAGETPRQSAPDIGRGC
jgi:hypothetical protein